MATLAGAVEALKTAAVDLSRLDVRTFVGTVAIDTATGDPDWSALMKAAQSSGQVKLALSTTIHIDGDCDYFEDTALVTDALRESHEAAITAGRESRAALIEMVKGPIREMIAGKSETPAGGG